MEAQRTKWVVDMVMAIDNEYCHVMEAQNRQIETIEEELKRAYLTLTEKESCSASKIEELEEEVSKVGFEITEANQRVIASNKEMAGLRNELQKAETIASAASTECGRLQNEVLTVSEMGSKIRRKLSNRAHLLREDLLRTKCDLRQQRKQLRSRGVGAKQGGGAMENEEGAHDKHTEAKRNLGKRLAQLSNELMEARNTASHTSTLLGKCYKPDEETHPVDMVGEKFGFCGAPEC
ncbi:hypothetical protein BSKO_05862 [Bryopsis sp. KO-2023]|nr:hypothetical protein BSKO_05862 [Bryopsis sp. KO-2023]